MQQASYGATDLTLYVQAVDATTGLAKIAIVASAVTASYVRTRETRTGVPVIALTSAAAAHNDGGWIAVDAINLPGAYRFDAPDAAFASGADEVLFGFVAADAIVTSRSFALVPHASDDLVKVRKMICNSRQVDATDDNKETVLADDGVSTFAEITHSEPETGVVREEITFP